MHSAPIQLAAVDSLGQRLVTYAPAAADRTLRIWQASDGSLRRTVRFAGVSRAPLSALALSPDGSQLALAWAESPARVALFEPARDQIARWLQGVEQPVAAIAYVPDGKRLVLGLRHGGVLLFDVSSGRVLARDGDVAGAVTTLAVDRAGRIFVAAEDRSIRAYGPALNLLVRGAPRGQTVSGLAISPDGQRIAVGCSDAPRVDVLSSTDLRDLFSPSTQGVTGGELGAVAWSPDGETLCAAGKHRIKDINHVRCWRGNGRATPRDLAAGQATIKTLAVLGGESVLFTDTSPAWGVIAANGKLLTSASAQGLPLQPGGLQADFAGSILRLDTAAGVPPLLYAVREHQIGPSPVPDRKLRAPLLERPGWKIEAPPGGAARVNGAAVSLSTGESVVGWALAPNDEHAVLATDRALLVLNAQAAVRRRIELPSEPRSVQVSGNGRLALAALSDGTVRWYSIDEGHERLALYIHRDGKRWVSWTPSGFYDTSFGGESLLGWEVPRDRAQPADFFRIGLLRERFYRPDVVARVLFAASERAAREEADATLERPPAMLPLRQLFPPVVRILEPLDQSVVKTRVVSVRAMVRSPSGRPLTSVWPLVQGRTEQTQARGVYREPVPSTPPAPTAEQPHTMQVPLPPEDSTIAVLASTATTKSEPALIRLRWEGRGGAVRVERPNLYMVSVGVAAYRQPSLRLAYPAKDARDLAAAFKAQEGKRYNAVAVSELVDEKAVRTDILASLEWLVQKTTSQDVAVIFLAGHGVSDSETGRYGFLPFDYDSEGGGTLEGQQIQLALSRIRGRVLLFLDTCHSGGVIGLRRAGALELTRLTNELASAESGIIVYAASTGEQTSREATRWGNGVFTKAAVEGLRGSADPDRSGRITTSTLEHYISSRVRELTHEEQTPTTAKPNTVPEFLLAVVPVRRSIYQRWWFWGAIGAAAIGIIVGGVVGAAPWEEKPQVIRFE